MNANEIAEAALRHLHHPVLGKATRFLQLFRDRVNMNSTGWDAWVAPAKACDKLFALIKNPNTATQEALNEAMIPIKAFGDRNDFVVPGLEGEKPTRRTAIHTVYLTLAVRVEADESLSSEEVAQRVAERQTYSFILNDDRVSLEATAIFLTPQRT